MDASNIYRAEDGNGGAPASQAPADLRAIAKGEREVERADGTGGRDEPQTPVTGATTTSLRRW